MASFIAVVKKQNTAAVSSVHAVCGYPQVWFFFYAYYHMKEQIQHTYFYRYNSILIKYLLHYALENILFFLKYTFLVWSHG
ncbi:hypothetical protein GDO86_014859 [Hymenochirus boettgeri]|uniref:Uncharacterized protein n=1 Tax=Hymenochirus boettgeri TaxID=247094 RepID=A0A8T2JV81_9PIPI|nr:hypothetical protein GDO86_014859 [Hymenochirus boettgeri]